MKIRKRNGSEVTFNKQNIIEAISRANAKVRIEERLTIQEIKDIAKVIEDTYLLLFGIKTFKRWLKPLL